VIGVLSITSPIVPPSQKVCANCHIVDVIISPMGSVHYNACCSKSTIQKSGFLHDSITTNDEHVLLTIEAKWFEVIMHMTESEFLYLHHPKQVQLFISICIHGYHPHFPLLAFKKTSNNLSHKGKTSLKCKGLVIHLAIIHSDNV
jgi:hypothetical protein